MKLQLRLKRVGPRSGGLWYMYRHIFVDSSDERINASESGQLLWFGDCAPNLDRDWPMLFEQVARRLINVEELEYALESDEESSVRMIQ